MYLVNSKITLMTAALEIKLFFLLKQYKVHI